jgi:hypothetical protein
MNERHFEVQTLAGRSSRRAPRALFWTTCSTRSNPDEPAAAPHALFQTRA